MGLRCSLFGHAFEEPVTERDRETRGAEVVVTVREVRTCSRCGAEQVIAENTEVRHLGADDGDRPEPTDVGDSSTEEPTPAVDEEAGEQAEHDGEILEDTAGGDSRTEPTGAEADEADADITQFVDAAEPEEGATPAGPDTDEAASTEEANGTAEPESGEEPSEWDGPPDSAIESEDAEFIGSTDEAEPTAEADDSEATDELEATDDSEVTDELEATDESAESRQEPGGESSESAERLADEDGPGEQPPGSDEPGGDQESPDQKPPEGEQDEGSDEDEEDDAIIMDNTAGAEDRESDVGRRELAGSGNMFDTNAPEGGDGDSPDKGSGFGDPGEPAGSERPTEASRLDAGGDSSPGEADSTDRWPGEDTGADEPGDDSSFQFGPDMHPDPEERDEETTPPSGLTTGGTVDVTGPTDEDPPEAVICPECGFEASGVGSSRRAGDICPECHGGYLAERR